MMLRYLFFFFQAEDGIRDIGVTGVQTCALPIFIELANHTLLLAKHGREIAVDDSAAPIVDAGAVIGAVLVFRDITERKRAFEALAQTDRRKSEFLAILGHELRSPLSAVLHGAQAMHTRPGDPVAVETASGVILRQARQLARLVEELL